MADLVADCPWSYCLQYCGSCYVHSTMSMVQDRISVATRGRSRVMLGRQVKRACQTKEGAGSGQFVVAKLLRA